MNANIDELNPVEELVWNFRFDSTGRPAGMGTLLIGRNPKGLWRRFEKAVEQGVGGEPAKRLKRLLEAHIEYRNGKSVIIFPVDQIPPELLK